jgi:hypothetical protein
MVEVPAFQRKNAASRADASARNRHGIYTIAVILIGEKHDGFRRNIFPRVSPDLRVPQMISKAR